MVLSHCAILFFAIFATDIRFYYSLKKFNYENTILYL